MIVLLAVTPELSRPSLTSDDDAGNLCSRSGPARVIYHSPHSSPDKFDIFLAQIIIFSQIASNLFGLSDHGPVCLLDLVDEAGPINRAAIGDRCGDHGHLEGASQNVALTDR